MKYVRKKRNLIYVLCLVSALLFSGCSLQKIKKVTYVDTAMGTIVQQTLYVQSASNDSDANGVQDSVQGNGVDGGTAAEIMSLLNSLEKNILSWREEASEIYHINAADLEDGYKLSKDMQKYLEMIGDVWKKSEGALDVTIGNVTRLWDIDAWAQGGASAGELETSGEVDTETFQVPGQDKLQEALIHTGFEKIEIKEGKIYMPENIELDLGAVGKGIACDEVLAFLENQEVVSGAVITIGGSVLTYGEKPDGSSWKIAIQHPRESGTGIATLQLRGNWCVSTSGDYERYVEKDGVRYHHIIDPKTGYPADSGIISVTIVSESGILSDALSTACFVMGRDAGLALAKQYGVQAYLIDKDLNVYMTEGMDKLLVLE